MTLQVSGTLGHAQERSAEIARDLQTNAANYRMLTGDRPTGRLHIGHYFGSLANRVKLQNLGVDTMVLVADYQVIYDRDGVGNLQDNVINMVADYLASGIDPERTPIFAHSAVTALNQLMLPFLCLVTEAELHRNPTVKEEHENSGRAMNGLMLTFPIHQAADILFCKSNIVPVGKDQLPHIEITRVVARRFDERFGRGSLTEPIFPQPDALLGVEQNILGMDGQKMSKSRGNTIELGSTPDQTAKVIKKAVTDADRRITFDPVGRPEVANLLTIAGLCLDEDPQVIAERIGDGGGGTLKKVLTEAVNEYFAPHRARRAELMADPGQLLAVLRRGNEQAIAIAEQTLAEVREAMQMNY